MQCVYIQVFDLKAAMQNIDVRFRMVTWLYSCRLLGRKISAPAPSGPKKKICDEVCHLQLDKLQMGSELARGGFGKVNPGRLVQEKATLVQSRSSGPWNSTRRPLWNFEEKPR
jgi:hypothetical protein